jgi:hypothetical protein
MIDFSDILIVLGAVLLLVGAYLTAGAPATVIVAGLFLLAAGLVRAANRDARGTR